MNKTDLTILALTKASDINDRQIESMNNTYSDEDTSIKMWLKKHESIEETKAAIEVYCKENNKKWLINYLVFKWNEFVWYFWLTNLYRKKNWNEKYNKCSIFYMVSKKFRWQWLATYFAELAIENAFETLKVNKIEAEINSDNIWSIKVIEKMNFRRIWLKEEEFSINLNWEEIYKDVILFELLKKNKNEARNK